MKVINPCEVTINNNNYNLVANPNTDAICKYETYSKDSASFYYTNQEGDFTIKAKVTTKVTTKGTEAFDAAFLMVRQENNKWIKLAVELGVDNRYNVVSVITDHWSDDANGELLDGNVSWIRITRKGNFFGLHYSADGIVWRFVRAFGMGMDTTVAVGFGIQAPKSECCEGLVEDFSISNESIKNFRDGN